MKENISAKTVCGYYACASVYGLDLVMKKSDFNYFKSQLLKGETVFYAVYTCHTL